MADPITDEEKKRMMTCTRHKGAITRHLMSGDPYEEGMEVRNGACHCKDCEAQRKEWQGATGW